jgi:DNA invertase Pin-like site-specific DNA recombinase
VDRLGRSLTDLLAILQGLHDKGVDLFLHQQGLDTSTTAGKAMFQMLGVFAEFERGIIRERVNAGLARAKAKGTKLGRRRIGPPVEARILELRAKGHGIHRIRKTLGLGTSVVQRVFNQDPWEKFVSRAQTASKGKGASLKATEQPIDTGTAAGKCFLDMLGVFAEFEINLRRERQLEGIAKAKEAGVYKGRPASIDAVQVRQMKADGLGPSKIEGARHRSCVRL